MQKKNFESYLMFSVARPGGLEWEGCSGGLGAEPPGGDQGQSPWSGSQGAKPPEAEEF